MNEKAKKHFLGYVAGTIASYMENKTWDATELVYEAIERDLGMLADDPEGAEIYKSAFLRSMMHREIQVPKKIMKLVK